VLPLLLDLYGLRSQFFFKVDYLVQTQMLGLQEIPIDPVLSKRFSAPSDFRRVTVDKNVAARTSEIQQ
jgi:hypothetical protein